MMRSFFLTCLVMSLILAPGLHKAFLLLCLPFFSQPLQVSCRGLTIESPSRNACSTLGVSECWSWSAENLLVSSILNLRDCAALLVIFAGGLGMWLVYCEVLGAVVVVVAFCHLCMGNLLLLLVLEELLWAGLPGSVGWFGLTEGAGPSARTTVSACRGTTVLGESCGWVRGHLCLLTVMSWDSGGLGCYVFPW